MADAYDVAIIGGGIVSLATARALGERAPRARLPHRQELEPRPLAMDP